MIQMTIKKLVFFMMMFIGLFFVSYTAHAKPNHKYASIVMDADTGVIISQRYADKKLHPASLTKIMTLIMMFDALEQNKVNLNTRMRVSRHAEAMVPSKLGLKAGSSIRVKDAIYALVTKSANDVAVVIAEHLGGSERNFARLMTRKAHQFGMKSTTFRNASGLHDVRQITTARDMAKLARVSVVNYPYYYRYFSTRSFTYAGKTYKNHNKLLGNYNGVDGIKTGYINASGFNLVASAVRNNRRIIGVVFGGRTGKSRNAHMVELLDNGFKRVKNIRYAKAIAPVPPRKPFIKFADSQVGVQKTENALPEIQTIKPTAQNWAAVNTAIETGKFEQVVGQGAADSAAERRIETGLMAIAAHKYGNSDGYKLAAFTPDSGGGTVTNNSDMPWAIQVGAFSSRAKTDAMLHKTMQDLSPKFAGMSPTIAPLKTPSGWIFRARINGFDKQSAQQACAQLKGCMAVAPRKN